ncbi:MAG: glycoside hydrolase family 97 catalytic domain-containing protein [Prolixibacteraceae bacterium]
MNRLLFFLALSFLSGFSGGAETQPVKLFSPDGKLCFIFSLDEEGIFYKVDYLEQPVILASALGITCNGEKWNKGVFLKEMASRQQDTLWHPVYGERAAIRDHFNEMTFSMGKGTYAVLNLVVRAYNEGIAFRYFFPEADKGGPYLHITDEQTGFSLPEHTKAWHTARAQSLHQLLPLKDWPGESDRPLTLELYNGLFACLAEAEMVDYSRTKFRLDDGKPNTIRCSVYGDVDEIAPFASPWRVIMVAEKATDLLQNNDLILNLNPLCQIADPSWIKPGKVMREVTLSTEGSKKLVDFAVARNISYIHFDAGWYGYEYLKSSDATTVTVDPLRNPKGDLDLQEAIRYARSKDIGVFLYVNQRALTAQLDTLLPLFRSWGVAGIKFGFVQVGSHRWTTWLHEAVRKCARYRLMVDIHDEYRPTGFSRTFPNLMTQEGIRGNEEMPDATNNTILPFTRFVAGAADYTFCYYFRKELGHPQRHIQTTSAHQLALPVVYYSPLQWMYWYDKPEDYQGEPELEFWDAVPTTWDDTKVLDGRPGQFISIVRRSGDDWYLGTITNNDARQLQISLSFLPKGKTFEAKIYEDDPTVGTRTKVAVKTMKVDASSVFNIRLAPSGGQAVRLRPL